MNTYDEVYFGAKGESWNREEQIDTYWLK